MLHWAIVFLVISLIAGFLGFSGVSQAAAGISKLLFVLAISGYHGWAVGYARKLAGGKPTLSGRTLRLVNEVPALATVVIVVLVVVKPF